jgi:aryl-alcohol dehydrogenase-like predicted oxidoreductase
MSAPASSTLPFTPLALGCWAFAGDRFWGPFAERDAVATVHAALDRGIRFLDTAPVYGEGLSEEIVGRALRGRRGDALIATKVSAEDCTAEGVRTSGEASLRRLQTDVIDLLQIHWVGDEARLDETFAAFEALRDAGKVRACGVCNFGPRHLARLRAAGHGWITHQVPYNLLWRAVEFQVAPQSAADGLGLLAYSPLQQGLLTGRFRTADEVPVGRQRSRHFHGDRPLARHGGPGCETETFAALTALAAVAARLGRSMAQVSLAWLRQQPGVVSILAGARSPEQVAENASSLDLTLDAATLAELDRATADLKAKLGPDPDMWAPESRYR